MINDQEHKILTSAIDVTARNLELMSKANISSGKVNFKLIADVEGRTSEIEIDVFKNNELVDVIEFFVMYKGEMNVDVNETVLWLEDTYKQIIAKNSIS